MSPTPQEIARRAIGLEHAARRAFLARACERDPALLDEVESILISQATVTIASGPGSGDSPASAAEGPVPAFVGEYRVVSRLGAGAMGVVYLAEQPSPRRRIALKVINPARLSEASRARFDLETGVLARLKHPGIAAIYHAGSALVHGRDCPYFAMELVQGVPLDDAAAAMSVRERVRLVIEAAGAVEHAHQRGVIHRDLKPGNILVDETGRVKVLDFGVARAVDGDAPRALELVGTLPYMSPEQLAADPAADTRSDVYALGVILHELLTGELPHDLRGKTIDEATAVVSAGLSRAPRAIARRLPRDLDAVIRRALAPCPDDRYPSASALAADMRRYLDTRPVEAMGRRPVYLATRFAQRNAALVAAMGASLLIGAAGVVGIAWQAAEATAGWSRARAEADRASAVNTLLTSTLASADPEQAMGEALTVRDFVDQLARDAGRELMNKPDVAGAIEVTLANTYRGLGVLAESERHARAGVAAHEAAFGRDDPATLEARRALVMTLVELGRHDEAQALIEGVIAGLAARGAGGVVDVAIAKGDLARIHHEAGRPEDALRLWEDALGVLEANPDAADAQTLVVMHNYAGALAAMGRYAEAIERFTVVVERREALFGPDHPQTLVARSMLAGVIQKTGDDAEAARQLRLVLEGRRRVLGDDHHGTLTSMGNLGVALIRLGELDEAEELTRASLAGYRRVLGTDHAKTLVMMGNLAYLLEERGRIDEAAAMYREVIDARERVSGGRDPETWSTYNNLAMLLMARGQPEEAARLFQRLLQLCREQLPAGHVYTALFRNNYGECLMDLGRPDEARAELTESHPVLVSVFGEGHERTVKSAGRIAELERRAADLPSPRDDAASP